VSRSVAASPTLGLAAFALVLALGSCERSPLLRIGVIAYEYEADHNIEGFSTDKASRLAAREINAGGRIRVELETVMVDDAPESSVSAVSLLANRRGAAVIVGPSMSRQAIAAGAAAERARIPLISSVSSNPDTTRERRYVFRMCYLDPVQARSQARFALERFAPRSASLIWYESDPSSSTQAAVPFARPSRSVPTTRTGKERSRPSEPGRTSSSSFLQTRTSPRRPEGALAGRASRACSWAAMAGTGRA